jgi:acyl-CoA dehydrogenase
MSHELALVVTDILTDHCTPERLAAAEGGIDRSLYTVLDSSGFLELGIDEASGGSGGTLSDVVTVARLAGEYAAPAPVGEALLARWLLATAGLERPEGIVTAASGQVSGAPAGGWWRISGVLPRAGYARGADHVVGVAEVDADRLVFVLPVAAATVWPGANLAREPRDRVEVSAERIHAALVPASVATEFELRARLTRAAMIGGALDRAMALVVGYANQRRQFGGPISAFQAVRQQVALAAGEASAVRAAVEAAAKILDRDLLSAVLAVNAAKVRASQAAGVVAAIAHQVHGAIGITYEHSLRFVTTRLWSWRDEEGAAAVAARAITATAMASEPNGLWPLVVGV